MRRLRLVARLVILGCVFAGVLAAIPVRAQSAVNVLLFIGDGMGPGQVEAGRCFMGSNLVFEGWAHQAQVTTRSASSAVTDSAAAATAMATGHKVKNGVLSMAIPGDGSELESVLETLQRKGKWAGLVTTTSITHATPAAFGAHENSRNNAAAIAADYLQRSRPHVLLGGGGAGMSVAAARAAGYACVTDRAQLQALNVSDVTPVSGQFGSGYMPYEYSGLGALPHLSEMTKTAIDLLEQAPQGFFLMVEGGRIDHACHDNNITNCVREVAEFDRAVRVGLAWASKRTDTLILVTADHETGGLKVLQDNGPGKEPSVSWSTGGHSGANVGLSAWGAHANLVTGVLDNTDVYRITLQSQGGMALR